MAGAHDQAFALARAVYASPLRPRGVDELRARVLAGAPAPLNATRELRDFAELRAAITGEDAASRQLLETLARRTGVEALLVVGVSGADAPEADAGAPEADASAELQAVHARLFLTDTAELDAARYEPDASGWRDTVSSLTRRFPAPAAAAALHPVVAPARLVPDKQERSFFRSPWLWGAVGAAVLLGGAFFFASQDTGGDAIHLQLRVPR
jgi:hypothetical protein